MHIRPLTPAAAGVFSGDHASPLRCPAILSTVKDLVFQAWTPWADRHSVHDCERPGVYLLGRFDEEPPAPPVTVDPLDARVIYIGETCGQLRKRWRQFHRAAFEQKHGHSGGMTFAEQFCDNRIGAACPWLYVAALPVCMDEPHASAYIRFVERSLIWEHVQRHGRLPVCNRK